jgi:hypothetical protein
VVGEPAGGLVTVAYPQLAPGAVAIGVDRSLGHAQLPGDLLGGKVAVDEPQAFSLPRSQEFDRILDRPLRRAHKMSRLTSRANRR